MEAAFVLAVLGAMLWLMGPGYFLMAMIALAVLIFIGFAVNAK